MSKFLTFDDVLIKPQFSDIRSRSEVDTNGLIVSANMKDITGTKMCKAMYDQGQVGCLHRFWTIEENIAAIDELLSVGVEPWASVGFEKDRLSAIASVKSNLVVVVDVAHGYSQMMLDFLRWAQSEYPDLRLVAGNFVEFPSKFLDVVYGLHGIKIGVGPGSKCETRGVTGHGYPQLQAVINTVRERTDYLKHISIIADGGCKTSGDVVKALAAGADMVMTGGLLAFSDKCNSTSRYAGSASVESYAETGKTASHRTPEGIAEYVEEGLTKSTEDTLRSILAGVRSGFSYSGARTLADFHRRAELVEVSSSTILENSTRPTK
jgi:IMP dehydrogenase